MSLRRTVLACAVTFVCALAVFTLPRFAWNSLQGAVQPRPGAVTTAPTQAPAEPAQAAPRSPGQRLTGLLGFAIFVLRVPVGQTLFRALGATVTRILSFSYVGSEFVFGEIGKQHSSLGVIFAFQIMPAIIFVSALFAIMYYLGIMQVVVKAFAVVMNKIMGASGAESLNVAASIFMGQTEAPLTIRPFLATMTQSELMTVMTAGMAHVSGSIMAAYIAFGIEARHLLTAVIMT